MKKAIELLSLVNEHNFLNVYFVITKHAKEIYAIESIAFKTREEAQRQCDYLNKKHNTTIYIVYNTCMHI